jgi:hypothetical protein
VKHSKRMLLLSTGALAGVTAAAGTAAADSCSNLASLNLTDVTITAAQTVPAGNYTAANGQTFNNVPTFCRVAATASPTSERKSISKSGCRRPESGTEFFAAKARADPPEQSPFH